MSAFVALGVPTSLAKSLSDRGITEPFPIQRETLPDSIAGRNVLGRGRTGSGKTLAFSLPMLTRLASGRREPHRPRGLVLAPTRELATQIAETLTPLAQVLGMKVTTIFGGVSQYNQTKALRNGVDIVVACPGRLEDLMRQGEIDLDSVEISVVDEADHMADLGFLPGVTRILEATAPDGQRMLFSATLDGDIDRIVKRFLPDAIKHEAEDDDADAGTMTHRVFLVNTHDDKLALVDHLASGTGKRILFTRTKHGAIRLAEQLTKAGIPAVDLHGNLPQRSRDRNLRIFSAPSHQGGVRVLVATDVAARGVHVDDVELVIHVDQPAEHKAYLHRSGRTARAGASGTVVTITLPAQRRDLQSLLRRAQIDVPIERTAAGNPEIHDLVGEQAERFFGPPPQEQRPAQRRNGGNSGGRPAGGRSNGRPAGRAGGRSEETSSRPAYGQKTYGDKPAYGDRPAYAGKSSQRRGEQSDRPAQRGSRPDNRTDNRYDNNRGDARSENRYDSRSGDNRGGDNRYGNRSEARSDNRYDSRGGDNRYGNRTDSRSDNRTDNRGDNRSDSRGSSRPDNRYGNSSGKPTQRRNDRTGTHTSSRPADRGSDRPAGESGSHRPEHHNRTDQQRSHSRGPKSQQSWGQRQQRPSRPRQG